MDPSLRLAPCALFPEDTPETVKKEEPPAPAVLSTRRFPRPPPTRPYLHQPRSSREPSVTVTYPTVRPYAWPEQELLAPDTYLSPAYDNVYVGSSTTTTRNRLGDVVAWTPFREDQCWESGDNICHHDVFEHVKFLTTKPCRVVAYRQRSPMIALNHRIGRGDGTFMLGRPHGVLLMESDGCFIMYGRIEAEGWAPRRSARQVRKPQRWTYSKK